MIASVRKTVLLPGVRLEPTMATDFAVACGSSNLKPPEALRLAMRAMIEAHKRYGRIPRDMEICQARLVEAPALEAGGVQ